MMLLRGAFVFLFLESLGRRQAPGLEMEPEEHEQDPELVNIKEHDYIGSASPACTALGKKLGDFSNDQKALEENGWSFNGSPLFHDNPGTLVTWAPYNKVLNLTAKLSGDGVITIGVKEFTGANYTGGCSLEVSRSGTSVANISCGQKETIHFEYRDGEELAIVETYAVIELQSVTTECSCTALGERLGALSNDKAALEKNGWSFNDHYADFYATDLQNTMSVQVPSNDTLNLTATLSGDGVITLFLEGISPPDTVDCRFEVLHNGKSLANISCGQGQPIFFNYRDGDKLGLTGDRGVLQLHNVTTECPPTTTTTTTTTTEAPSTVSATTEATISVETTTFDQGGLEYRDESGDAGFLYLALGVAAIGVFALGLAFVLSSGE